MNGILEKIKEKVRSNQEKIVGIIQILLCGILTVKVVNKEIRQKLKFSEKQARKEAKNSEKIRKDTLKYARKLARAEFKIKEQKLKAKAKMNKKLAAAAIKKFKQKAKKSKNKKSR